MARQALAPRNRDFNTSHSSCRSSRDIQVEDDICSLSDSISRVSFYPSPIALSEEPHYSSVSSALRRPTDDLGLQLRSPSSGLSVISRRVAYTFEDVDSTPSFTQKAPPSSPSIEPIPEEDESNDDDWSSGSEGSSDDIDGCFAMISLEDVTFPSLNRSMYGTDDPSYADEERGRDHQGHHRYRAEHHNAQPSSSEHYAQRNDVDLIVQRTSSSAWSSSMSYASYLAYIKTRAEEAQRREAQRREAQRREAQRREARKSLLRDQMAVAETLLNRWRHQPRRRMPRVLLARDKPERAYVNSPLRIEVL